MVVESDKGRETVVCYRSTYSALLEEHFSNTDFYQTVGESDIVGQDLTSVTNNLTNDINLMAAEAPDEYHRKIIKSLLPHKETKFPEGRISLKTHKSDITHTHIPVRPIISNVKSPTYALASYLGKCLTSNLGQVSNKHIESTEEFASFVKNCTSRG